MRGCFNFFLVLVCIAFVWGGAGDAYVAVTNLSPTKVTCRDLLGDVTGARWLEVSDCRLDYDNIVEVKYKFGVVEGYYAPLVPRNTTTARSPILMKVEKPDELVRLGTQDKYVGVVQFGLSSDDSVRKAVQDASVKITRDFLIMEPGTEPQLAVSLTMLGLGFLCGMYLWRQVKKASQTQEPEKVIVDEDAFRPPDALSDLQPSKTRDTVEEVLEPMRR